MEDETFLPFPLPAVCRKKVSVAFDGGLLSSDGGVLVLRDVERRLGLARRLAGCLTDRRDRARIEHDIVAMLRLRMLLIAAGYEDADGCDTLRADPVFKMAVGRVPESGNALCSQPTMLRLENAPSKVEIAQMMAAMVDLFCGSWARPPAAMTLDRRHAGPGAWAPAARAVQRTLRRALLSRRRASFAAASRRRCGG